MLVGPKLQEDLYDTLVRFRIHNYALFSGDIEKMSRQIINTVTYGTSSAPYLAVKCLQQIGKMEMDRFPETANVIMLDFYMDDIMTIADSLQEAVRLQKEIDNILKGYGFPLRKWCANHTELISSYSQENCEINFDFTTDSNDQVKVLGMAWLPSTDEIYVKSNLKSPYNSTKRVIIYVIAQLFDPLGLFNPVIVTVKVMLQELWQ